MKNLTIAILISILSISCNSFSKKTTSQPSSNAKDFTKSIVDTSGVTNIEYSLIDTKGDTLCLYGQHKLGEIVTLADNSTGYLFESKTSSYTTNKSDFESDGAILTTIKNQPQMNTSGIYIAFFKTMPSDYFLLKQEKINNYELSKNIDSLIRSTSIIDSLFNENKGTGRYWDVDSELKETLPKLTSIKIKDQEILIASYELSKDVYGPKLAILNKTKIIPLTGQCSASFFYTYSMFGKYYIYTGSGCCDCGIIAYQIFEIKRDTIIKMFEDYSFSN
jgi:hypothetical protein